MANLPASVRQRLLNLATEGKEDFGLVLTRYRLERFLYHLSVSPHRDSFVLKVLCYCNCGPQRLIVQREISVCSDGECVPCQQPEDSGTIFGGKLFVSMKRTTDLLATSEVPRKE